MDSASFARAWALMTCPKCIAREGLETIGALKVGRDAVWRGAAFVLRGKPLDAAALAGVAQGILKQVVDAGALCGAHCFSDGGASG